MSESDCGKGAEAVVMGKVLDALRADDAAGLAQALRERPELAQLEGFKNRSLLDEAVILRGVSCVKTLIQFGADAAYRDHQGNGALDLLLCALACEGGQAGRSAQLKAVECARELARAGADLSHVGQAGWSALALCARFQLWLVMEELLRLGARPVDPALLCDQAAMALERVYVAAESDALLAAYKGAWMARKERRSIAACVRGAASALRERAL